MPQVYQVKDWDTHYENNKSRERDECSFVCVPNKQDGLGFLRLMAEKDGASIYGIFNLIIGACSRQRRPRNGWLTDDGTENGIPWTVEDLAMRWRRSAGDVSRALDVLSSERIGWIGKADIERTPDTALTSSARVVPAECPPGALERREGNEGNRKKEGSAEPQAASAPPDPASVSFPQFPTAGRPNVWTLSESFVSELVATYPGVDVRAECRKAHLWIKTHLPRRKTAGGMPAFLNTWLSRCQNSSRGGTNGQPVPSQQRQSITASVRLGKV